MENQNIHVTTEGPNMKREGNDPFERWYRRRHTGRTSEEYSLMADMNESKGTFIENGKQETS
jgi:hypothetical protein